MRTDHEISHDILDEMRKIRDEYHALGDQISLRVINLVIKRIAISVAGRTDAGRKDDEPDMA